MKSASKLENVGRLKEMRNGPRGTFKRLSEDYQDGGVVAQEGLDSHGLNNATRKGRVAPRSVCWGAGMQRPSGGIFSSWWMNRSCSSTGETGHAPSWCQRERNCRSGNIFWESKRFWKTCGLILMWVVNGWIRNIMRPSVRPPEKNILGVI